MRSALFLTIAIQVHVVKLRGKSTSRDGGLDRRDNSSLPYSNPDAPRSAICKARTYLKIV